MITERFDLPVLDCIAEHLACPALDFLMPAITHLADAGAIWILLSAVLLCIPKCRKTGAAMGLALLLGALCTNVVLKPLVARMRPFDYQLLHFGRVINLLISAPTDFSFPSGHTMASAVSATVLLIHHRRWGIPVAILAGLIAFSRLYLYVHYPTDVLFSLALGIGIGFWASYLTAKGLALFRKT